jgi:hypothetical protein
MSAMSNCDLSEDGGLKNQIISFLKFYFTTSLEREV